MHWHRSTACAADSCVEVAFVKSNHSTTNGCVEVGVAGREIRVRDSKDPGGPVLSFTPAEWRAFLAGVRDGQFDHPDADADAVRGNQVDRKLRFDRGTATTGPSGSYG